MNNLKDVNDNGMAFNNWSEAVLNDSRVCKVSVLPEVTQVLSRGSESLK